MECEISGGKEVSLIEQLEPLLRKVRRFGSDVEWANWLAEILSYWCDQSKPSPMRRRIWTGQACRLAFPANVWPTGLTKHVSTVRHWTVETIVKRQEELVTLAIKTWPLTV
jgi:hypothetical protein